LTKTSDANFAC